MFCRSKNSTQMPKEELSENAWMINVLNFYVPYVPPSYLVHIPLSDDCYIHDISPDILCTPRNNEVKLVNISTRKLFWINIWWLVRTFFWSFFRKKLYWGAWDNWLNSLVAGRWSCNHQLVTSHIKDRYLEHHLWNCLQLNASRRLGAVRHRAITWANADPDLWCHMVSLSHKLVIN